MITPPLEDEDVILVVVPLSYVMLLESIVTFDPDWASSEDWERIDGLRGITIEDTEVLCGRGLLETAWDPEMDSDEPRDYTMIPNRPEVSRYSLAQLEENADDE